MRSDEQWLQAKLDSSQSCFYALHNDKVITVDNQPLCLDSEQYKALKVYGFTPVFLGTENSLTFFTINFIYMQRIRAEFPQAQARSLRDLAYSIDMKTASILAYALLMNRWISGYNFCRRCGNKYVPLQGGHILKCSSKSCTHTEFPRINPAVIMRVTCGDKILLARQSNWPENRYSVLAGFVETGETLEHAVMREIKEESGIDVDQISLSFITALAVSEFTYDWLLCTSQ